jgi:hypothetical protein
MMMFGYIWAGTFAVPPLAQAAPEFLDAAEAAPPGMFFVGLILTFTLGSLGWFLFGLASLRAVVLPSVSAWLVMVGGILLAVLSSLMAPFALTVLGVGLAWMGWWLWSERAPAR